MSTPLAMIATCYHSKIAFHKTTKLEWQAAIAKISDLFITRFHCKLEWQLDTCFHYEENFPNFEKYYLFPGNFGEMLYNSKNQIIYVKMQ